MHSSRMRTTHSSSQLGGVSTRHPLLLWSSGAVAFCYGLLVWCHLVWWPSGLVPSGVVAFCYGLLSLDDHARRPPSIRRPPNQKAITEGHNRRPQQKAITEGHIPLGPGPLGSGTPPGPGTPLGADTPSGAGTLPEERDPLLQGMLGYHLHGMLG